MNRYTDYNFRMMTSYYKNNRHYCSYNAVAHMFRYCGNIRGYMSWQTQEALASSCYLKLSSFNKFSIA